MNTSVSEIRTHVNSSVSEIRTHVKTSVSDASSEANPERIENRARKSPFPAEELSSSSEPTISLLIQVKDRPVGGLEHGRRGAVKVGWASVAARAVRAG